MVKEPTTHFVYAKLWEPIQPIDRGNRYEDPLLEALEAANLGGVTGGGSLVSSTGEITYAGIDLELVNLEGALQTCRQVLEECGAPRGSEFLFNDTSASFGVTEAVAVYLDGVNLPAPVYRESDVNVLIDHLSKALGALGEFRHSWEGPSDTALYLYGSDAEHLFSLIQPVLLAYPLGQNARVVVRHGNPALNPRTIRIPMRATDAGA